MQIDYRAPQNIEELNDSIYCSMCAFNWSEGEFSEDHFFSRIVKFDPWYDLNNTRACFADGRVVSVVVIFERPMRIGESVLVSIPVEPFAELADEIKKRSKTVNTIFSGFSNGHINYLPTDIAHEQGGDEIGVCVFAPGSAELAIRASLDAIDDVTPIYPQISVKKIETLHP